MVVVVALTTVNQAMAMDFSNSSGLGDIWYVGRLDNGDVLAIDSTGKAAVFDYLNWTVIQNSQGFTFLSFSVDPSTNCILATKDESIYTNHATTPYIYYISNNTWSKAGPSLQSGNYTRPFLFMRNGEIYGVYNTGDYNNNGVSKLYKLVSGNWVLFSQGPKLTRPSGFYCSYDPYSDKLAIGYVDTGGSSWYGCVIEYDFTSGSWTNQVRDYSYRHLFSTAIFKNILGLSYYVVNQSGVDPYYINIGGIRYDAGSSDNGVSPFFFITKDFLSSKYYAGAYINDGTGTIMVNPGYPLNVACYDKFGNIFLGGPNGKVIVRDKGGVIRTDTSFYSEFVIHDVKGLAEEAAMAAQDAKISADLAANRAYYNGQSAAYWAYQAAQVAAQAANTPPIITKVQGQNGATCTRGTSLTLVVTASDNGPPSNLRYRVTCDSYDSGWSSSNVLTVIGLSVPGAKTATIMVSDNPSAPDSGNIAQTTFTFFKI